jgi:hypothetical protein
VRHKGDLFQPDQQATVEAALAADREAALRDVFAATALGAMIASAPLCDRSHINKRVWAGVAYDWADAMLKARK